MQPAGRHRSNVGEVEKWSQERHRYATSVGQAYQKFRFGTAQSNCKASETLRPNEGNLTIQLHVAELRVIGFCVNGALAGPGTYHHTPAR